MDRNEFISKCDDKVKLIRTEFNLSQEKMAWKLGISKKTLIEIEKKRSSLGWTGAVALVSIFASSEIVASSFGGNPTELVSLLSFDGYNSNYPKTMGGKVWWNNIFVTGEYKIQQNIISSHYRLLDNKDRRICSSFDLKNIKTKLRELGEDMDD